MCLYVVCMCMHSSIHTFIYLIQKDVQSCWYTHTHIYI